MQITAKKTSLYLAILLFLSLSGTAFGQDSPQSGQASAPQSGQTQTGQTQAGQTPAAQTGQSTAPAQTNTPDKTADAKKAAETKKADAAAKKPVKTTKTAKKKADIDVSGSAEPDKVLFNRAMTDYKRGRYTEERLSLQTLINTYPDSEYLAKAKLGIADSYYKEGGVTDLTQSIAEYKDFITFFPFLDESAYAQMQVGMAHYRMMEKADRDTSQAQAAEQEFQTFLTKYPDNPLVPKAQQHLRNVQEVLADGEFRIATFYYLKGTRSYRAALARLNDVIERYPLYSQSDRALWLAGSIYDKAERRETADQLYARIVREYPNSRYVPDAKRKLTDAGVPIPQPDEKAVMVAAANKSAAQTKPSVVHRGTGLIRTGPDYSKAAKAGDPNLTPPDDNQSATDVLRPGASGPTLSAGGGGGAGNSVGVQVVPSGSSDSGTNTGTDPGAAVQPGIQPGTTVAAPASSNEGSLPAPMNSDAGPAGTESSSAGENVGGGAAAGAAGSGGSVAAPERDPSGSSPARPTEDSKEDTSTASDADAAAVASGKSVAPTAAAAGAGGAAASPSAAPAASSSTAPVATPAKATSSESASDKSDKPDPSTESSSKKKKGIKKIIPW